MQGKGAGWLHAPLLALYPVVSLYATNRDEVPGSAAAATGLVVMVLTAFALVALIGVLRDRQRGGLLAGGLVLAIFGYRAVTEAAFEFARPTRIAGVPVQIPLTVMGVLLVASSLALRRRQRGQGASGPLPATVMVAAGVTLAVAALFAIDRLRMFSGPRLYRGMLLFWAPFSAMALAGLAGLRPEIARQVNAVVLRVALVLLLLPLGAWFLGARASTESAGAESPPRNLSPAETPVFPTPTEPPVKPGTAPPPWALPEGTQPPDIYHIVLDAYGRADVLREVYGLDNEPFLNELRARGFSVAEASTANYAKTRHTFASMFNLTYLQRFYQEYGISGSHAGRIKDRLQQTRLLELLKSWGYESYAFFTGFPVSDLMEVDRRIGREPDEVARFAELLLSLTPVFDARRLFGAPENPQMRAHRERILFILDSLPELAAEPSPKFVLAHLLIPHQPFVIDAKGKPRRAEGTVTDGVLTPEPGDAAAAAAYREGYAAQLQGANWLVVEALDELLARIDPGAIVIVQGDHGPGSHMDWREAEASDVAERYPVLNAIRFPGARPADFSDDVSLVNTYRILLNEYLGGTYEMLPNECFFPIQEGYEFRYVRVTDRVVGRSARGLGVGQGAGRAAGNGADGGEARATGPAPEDRTGDSGGFVPAETGQSAPEKKE